VSCHTIVVQLLCSVICRYSDRGVIFMATRPAVGMPLLFADVSNKQYGGHKFC